MPTLDENDPTVQYLAEKDKHLAKVMRMVGPLHYEVAADGYAFLVSEIVGQMLANKVADILYARLVTLCDGHVTPGAIKALTDEQVRSIGISNAKVQYIRNLTTGHDGANRLLAFSH